MNYEKLFSDIDSLGDKYIEFWKEICDIESPTADKAAVDTAGNYVVEKAKAHGWRIERFQHSVSGDVVVITMNPEADAAPIFFSGHLDTVHPKGLFGYPPTRVEGDRIYGPGVEDCKGGIVAAFMAMEALEMQGFTARPVVLMLQSDEEGGSRGSQKATINYMCQRAQGAVAFLNLEGSAPGKACLVRKGIVTFKFTVTGVEAHSSRCAVAGANAICDAAYKIIELEKLKDDAGLTCNVGVVGGGSVPNTVAGSCEFLANVRFVNAEQLEWVKEYAQKVADTVHVPGCTCKVEIYGSRLAMEYAQRNVELLEKMNAIFDGCGLSRLEGVKCNGGSDAAEITCAGVPCIDNLGVQGGRIHSAEEFAIIPSLFESAKRMAAVAMGI